MNCMTSALSLPFSATFLNKWFKAKSNIWWTFVTRGAREMWGYSPQKMQKKSLHALYCYVLLKVEQHLYVNGREKCIWTLGLTRPKLCLALKHYEQLACVPHWLTRLKVIWCFWAWARFAVNNIPDCRLKQTWGFLQIPQLQHACLVNVSRPSVAQPDLLYINYFKSSTLTINREEILSSNNSFPLILITELVAPAVKWCLTLTQCDVWSSVWRSRSTPGCK